MMIDETTEALPEQNTYFTIRLRNTTYRVDAERLSRLIAPKIEQAVLGSKDNPLHRLLYVAFSGFLVLTGPKILDALFGKVKGRPEPTREDDVVTWYIKMMITVGIFSLAQENETLNLSDALADEEMV